MYTSMHGTSGSSETCREINEAITEQPKPRDGGRVHH